MWPSGRGFIPDNLKAVLSWPHREDSIDAMLTFSNAVFGVAYTANTAYNAKFCVRGRVISLGGTTLLHSSAVSPRSARQGLRLGTKARVNC